MSNTRRVPLSTVVRAWGRLGCTGFGGPPAHLALLKALCVTSNGWLNEEEFDHAVATTAILPGPASTQMAIYCAWRVAGTAGAVLGGLAFIIPGLIAIIIAASVILAATPPHWLLGAADGAGAVVGAIALRTGIDLLRPALGSKRTALTPRHRTVLYAVLGGLATLTLGPFLALVLCGCGGLEIFRRSTQRGPASWLTAAPVLAALATLPALVVTAFTIGALSFGGGFVIIPLMRSAAISHHWLTGPQFLDAVALGQLTPGPVVQTIAVVGYGASGVLGALIAATIAFAPSFAFIVFGGPRFEALRSHPTAAGFLGGAAPAAMGAIVASAVILAGEMRHLWQVVVFAVLGLVWMVGLRRSPLSGLVAAAVVGGVLGTVTHLPL